MAGADARQALALGVGHVHALGVVRQSDHGRGEPQAHGLAWLVEVCVVEARADDVVHTAAMGHTGNEPAHEQACQRGVAVGEMVDVGVALQDAALAQLGAEAPP